MLLHTIILELGLLLTLDPDQIVSDYKEYGIDSHGVVYLTIDPSFGEYISKYFLKV